MYVKLCFSEMAASASDIVSVDFAEILFSRNCDDGDDNIGQFFFAARRLFVLLLVSKLIWSFCAD